jgi:hypothetical protein
VGDVPAAAFAALPPGEYGNNGAGLDDLVLEILHRLVNFSLDTQIYPEIKQKNLNFREDGHVRRDENFRLKLNLPRGIGHNIPSISFSSDENGEAETIVAKDIKGALWLLCLWVAEWKRIPTIDVTSRPGNPE